MKLISRLTLYLTLFLGISHLSFSQVEFSFEFGTSIKITPIDLYFKNFPSPVFHLDDIHYFTNQHKNLSGVGLEYGLSAYFPKIKAKFIYSQTIRYDHVYQIRQLSNPPIITRGSVNDLFLEHHLTSQYYFNRKDVRPYIAIGLSSLNSSLSYIVNSTNGFREFYLGFTTLDFGAGFDYKKLSFGFKILYGGRVSNPFSRHETQGVLIPEIRINYILPINRG